MSTLIAAQQWLIDLKVIEPLSFFKVAACLVLLLGCVRILLVWPTWQSLAANAVYEGLLILIISALCFPIAVKPPDGDTAFSAVNQAIMLHTQVDKLFSLPVQDCFSVMLAVFLLCIPLGLMHRLIYQSRARFTIPCFTLGSFLLILLMFVLDVRMPLEGVFNTWPYPLCAGLGFSIGYVIGRLITRIWLAKKPPTPKDTGPDHPDWLQKPALLTFFQKWNDLFQVYASAIAQTLRKRFIKP